MRFQFPIPPKTCARLLFFIFQKWLEELGVQNVERRCGLRVDGAVGVGKFMFGFAEARGGEDGFSGFGGLVGVGHGLCSARES